MKMINEFDICIETWFVNDGKHLLDFAYSKIDAESGYLSQMRAAHFKKYNAVARGLKRITYENFSIKGE